MSSSRGALATVTGAVVIGVGAVLLAFVVIFGTRGKDIDWTLLEALAVAAATLTAVIVYRHNSDLAEREEAYRRSEVMLEECKALLQRSYDAFTQGGETDKPPANDRLLWLSVARMLNRYLRLRQQVTEPVHAEIIGTYEDDARARFYDLFHRYGPTAFTLDYFCGESPEDSSETGQKKPANGRISPLDLRSVAALYEFASWRAGAEEPLHDTDVVAVFSRHGPLVYPGLEAYLQDDEMYGPRIRERRGESGDD